MRTSRPPTEARLLALLGVQVLALLAMATQWPVIGQVCGRRLGWFAEPGQVSYGIGHISCRYARDTGLVDVELYLWPTLAAGVLVLAGAVTVTVALVRHRRGPRAGGAGNAGVLPLLLAQPLAVVSLAGQWPMLALTCVHQQSWFDTGGQPQPSATRITCEYLRDGQPFVVELSTVPTLAAALTLLGGFAATVLVAAAGRRSPASRAGAR